MSSFPSFFTHWFGNQFLNFTGKNFNNSTSFLLLKVSNYTSMGDQSTTIDDFNDDLNEQELQNIEENIAEQLPQNNHYYFDQSQSFLDNLTAFFKKYRPGKIKHAKALAKEYKGQEEEVLDYLYYKYVTRVNALVNKKRIPPFRPGERLAPRIGDTQIDNTSRRLTPGPRKVMTDLPEGNHESFEEHLDDSTTKPKKSGVLKWLILVLIIGTLAALGYFFKDKFMGASSADNPEATTSEEVIEQPSEKIPQKSEEQIQAEKKAFEDELKEAKTAEDSAAIIEKRLDGN